MALHLHFLIKQLLSGSENVKFVVKWTDENRNVLLCDKIDYGRNEIFRTTVCVCVCVWCVCECVCVCVCVC
jgi:hypothetical protein